MVQRAAIRRSGAGRIETWLQNRKVRGAETLAKTALAAAQAQQSALPGERLAAAMVIRMAKAVTALDEEIARLGALIEARFREHPHAEVIRTPAWTGWPAVAVSPRLPGTPVGSAATFTARGATTGAC